MRDFVYTMAPCRVLFGTGTLSKLAAEVDALGAARVLVLSTKPQRAQAETIASILGHRVAGLFSDATMHTPIEVTRRAQEVARDIGADATVAIGGGSTIGLGKALSYHAKLPQIAVPTTYAGSEMTPILGQTEDGVKTTLNDNAVRPRTVIYDVELTHTLPPAMAVTSGLNAMAHAVEALYAREANPVISLLAEDGIRALGSALRVLLATDGTSNARYEALYGAWLCGMCLGTVGMALHHKLCHTLGGAFNLPHAETHSILLPHAAAYNAPAVPEAMARVARALGREDGDGAAALAALSRAVNAPRALRDIGMPESGIDGATDLALRNPYWNPRPLQREAIRALIANAWSGRA